MFRISQNGQEPVVDVAQVDEIERAIRLEPTKSLPRRPDRTRPASIWPHFPAAGESRSSSRTAWWSLRLILGPYDPPRFRRWFRRLESVRLTE